MLTNSTFETEDNSERIFGEFNFPMTTSSHTVQRLAKIQLLTAYHKTILFHKAYLCKLELKL